MNLNRQLNIFLSNQEDEAFTLARLSVSHDDEALDIVQDVMLKFLKHYSQKPQEAWRPLFYKVLYNQLTDYHRKRNFRSKLMRLFGVDNEGVSEIESLISREHHPEQALSFKQSLEQLQQALQSLSERQKQAVLMRSWQGFSTDETAQIMGLSSASVKTHYSRGLSKLKQLLGEDWP